MLGKSKGRRFFKIEFSGVHLRTSSHFYSLDVADWIAIGSSSPPNFLGVVIFVGISSKVVGKVFDVHISIFANKYCVGIVGENTVLIGWLKKLNREFVNV